MTDAHSVFIAAASFEDRSTVWVQKFLDRGGDPDTVYLADVVEIDESYRKNIAFLRGLGLPNIERVDRFRSMDQWNWARKVVGKASNTNCDLFIDVTCFPRELLGMLLFAVSVKRSAFRRVSVGYVAAPDGGYATQNTELPESERWLSRGVTDVRSIVGFPGMFRGDRSAHLVILAGHDLDRMLEIIEYVEPSRLTISGEQKGSSTVEGAREISHRVAQELRDRIQVPDIRGIDFSSSSIENVFENLVKTNLGSSSENVTLVAMNTKLSFVGAALYALCERTVRLIYAVPREYNPKYSEGVGECLRFDITNLLERATTK